MSFADSHDLDELFVDGRGDVALPPRLLSDREILELCQTVNECPARILVLCAESGMGKSYFLNCVSCDEEAKGSFVLSISLGGADECEAACRLTRFAREAAARCKEHLRVVVTIDDVPASDEHDVAREARAIKKIASAGGFVLVGLRPEAYALAEALEGSVLFGSSVLSSAAFPSDDLIARLTNGVPLLVSGVEADRAHSTRPLGQGRAYIDALGRAVFNSLRLTLPEEDLRLRLAMVLLGCGTLDDLRFVDGRFDAEMLAWLSREAPLFGCSCAMQEFSVARPYEDDYLIDIYGSLAGACSRRPQLVARCSDVLAMRGEFRRSGLVRGLCGDASGLPASSADWDLDYICAGLPKIVERNMEVRQGSSDADDGALTARAGLNEAIALCAIGELSERRSELMRRRTRLQELAETSGASSFALRRVSLLSISRDILSDASAADATSANIDDDPFSSQLVTHIFVMRDLVRGHVSDAFGRLVNDRARSVIDGIPSAWLHDDFHVCEVLLGERDVAFEDEGSVYVSQVLATVGSKRLRRYHAGMREALKVMMGRSASFEGAERVISRAKEYGDTLVEAFFLAIAAVADLRGGAYKRAHVRAALAQSQARAARSDYLSDVAQLIQAGVRARLGESIASSEDGMGDGAIRDLCRMFVTASSTGRKKGVRLEYLRRSSCTRDVLWILNFLLFDCGDASRAFDKALPDAWRSLVRIVFGDGSSPSRRAVPTPAPIPTMVTPVETRQPVDATAHKRRVKVSILGTFSVSVDGVPVLSNELAKRRARDLIAVLSTAHGHVMNKRKLIEVIWGDCDYVGGLQKLYEAVSAARKILRGKDPEANPVISSRFSGTVALNANEIAFDTDDFLRLALLAVMSEGNDRMAMRYAIEADRVYSGGIGYELPDVNGVFAAKKAELMKVHVDSNVAGSMAALREGKAYLAVELARGGLAEDGLREDAVECLVSALAAQGRKIEIVAAYEDYRRRLRRELNVRPSSEVRRHVENALCDAAIGSAEADGKAGYLNAKSNSVVDDEVQAVENGDAEGTDRHVDALKS